MLLTAALLMSSSLVQNFSCFPDDIQSNDRVVISLNLADSANDLPATGTLFLSSGIDGEGDQASSGVLKMSLDASVPHEADSVAYAGSDESSNYSVVLPLDAIGHASKNVRVKIELENSDHTNAGYYEMSCYTNVYGAGGSDSPRGLD
ncbi:MAG: hypothetical protein H7301_01125 [Cryobacterium sp.]|nr:hypothetical protein [Oligoflexia bacterium]